MDLSKNNCFSAEEAINYIPRIKKRKKVPVCDLLESSGLCPPPPHAPNSIMETEEKQLYDSSII